MNPVPPLVIDLDGTLVASDTLHEAAWAALWRAPATLCRALGQLVGPGRAALKRTLAERVLPDVTRLPYHRRLLERIAVERAAGRRIVLCSGADQRVADAVAAHLGCFDEVLASDGQTNLTGAHKAARLVQRFGEGGFDYAGNERADLLVWPHAREAWLVGGSARLAAELARSKPGAWQSVPPDGPGGGAPLQAAWQLMRPYQWLKNLLLFLPLIGAHRLLDAAALGQGLIAFAAFAAFASATYIVNDAVDIEHDRQHPHKRDRPLAAGRLSLPAALALAAALALTGAALAALLPAAFALWLTMYVLLTLAYTAALKRRVLLDVVALAALYTLRVVAGGAAMDITASFWLLSFSMFLFLSLAFVKRAAELVLREDQGQSHVAGRGYLVRDLPLVQAFGVAAGFAAVVVLALYLDSAAVARLYATPQLLWATLPLVLYWIGRLWFRAQHRTLPDDPLLFALRDRVSLACAGLFLLLLWAASQRWPWPA